MEVVWGAVISATVFLVIPLFGWFSRRATKEGRLTLKVERMGIVYAAMPESPERGTYERHYRRVISELNDWLDLDARALRNAVRVTFVGSYVLGVVIFVVLGRMIPPGNSFLSLLVGLLVAFVIAGGSFGGQYLLERRVSRKQAAERLAEKETAFRKGEPLTREV